MLPTWKDFTRGAQIRARTWYFNEWGGYAYSFKKTADHVYAQFKHTRSDAFWFPSIFLYRQWIELGLKSLWHHMELIDGGLGSVPFDHDLVKLWEEVFSWLKERRLISDDDDATPEVARVFSELNRIDPNSTAFRYPPTKLPHPDLINFSLEDFEKAIEAVDTMFFGLFQLLDEYEEYLGTMKSESVG